MAFWSSKFKEAEIHYSTPDKELYAIVSAFNQWRHYLEGSSATVEVLSDHQNLKRFMALPRLNDLSVNLECDVSPLSTAVVMTALVPCQVARRCVS